MAIVRKRTRTHADGTQKISWLVDYVDNAGTRRFETFYKKKDADARLTDINSELKLGKHTANAASITVAEAAKRWLQACRTAGHQRGTLRNYEGLVTLHILPLLGRYKLSKLTTSMVAGFRDELLKQNSLNITKKALTALKSILAEMQEQESVAQNVAVAVKIRKNKTTNQDDDGDVVPPTVDEANAMLAAVEGRWRPFLITALRTGLRSGELRGLTWANVDLANKVLHIEQRADRWGTLDKPKSRAGKRDVPLPPMAVNALREWQSHCPKSSLGLVFPTQVGTVMLHSNIMNAWFYPLQKKLGIVDDTGHPKYGLHALRHFYATWLISRQFPPKTIQTWMGHASITMTFDTYGKWLKQPDDHDMLAAAEAAITGSPVTAQPATALRIVGN